MTVLALQGAEGPTHEVRASWRRGVLALYDRMTPARDDATKSKVTLRDAVFIALGVAGMWGIQVATQSKTQAAIETWGTKVDGYIATQANTNTELQRQIDEARRSATLALVNDAETAKQLAELKGFLAGAGIKGVTK